MKVTEALNKADYNVMNQMIITNKMDGSIDTKLSAKLHGHIASLTPLPNGLMNLKYQD